MSGEGGGDVGILLIWFRKSEMPLCFGAFHINTLGKNHEQQELLSSSVLQAVLQQVLIPNNV